MFRKVELWIVGLLAVATLLAVTAFAMVVRTAATGDDRYGRIGDLALSISKLPETVTRSVRLLIHGDRYELRIKQERFAGRRGFAFHYPAGSDTAAGYLLLSRYDADRARSIVELVDLNAQKTIYEWAPDFAEINDSSAIESRLIDLHRDNAPARARAIHPAVTPDGDLVFANTSPLVKISPCNDMIWMVDRLFHHAIEPHPDGGYMVETFIEPPTIPGVSRIFREEAIAHVSEDGKLLYEKSVPQLLIENNLAYLVYGSGEYDDDPLHLNDVDYSPYDGPYFKRGDLFISLRNISAIVLYRPSTNKVLWMKRGPWVNQHDVDVLDDHRIAVFNNNHFSYADRPVVNGSNDVVIYDFARNTTVSPYASFLKQLDVRSPFEGRSEILADGDVFVEESEYGRLLRIGEDGRVDWEYINGGPDGHVYLVSWSRHIPPDEGAALAKVLETTECPDR